MMRAGVWLLPLLMAACSAGPSGDSPDAVCRRQAYDDPRVKALIMPNAALVGPDSDFALTVALRNATQDCLRKRGIAVRGGVEPVRPH